MEDMARRGGIAPSAWALLAGLLSVAAASADSPQRFHVIISTDCSPYSDWMSEALIYTHWKSGTSGGITRISSCDDPGYVYPKIWHPNMTLQVLRRTTYRWARMLV